MTKPIHLCSLFLLLFIVGCGQKKSGTTLKVSGAMALANSSYDGGLVIYGRSPTTNQFFTIPLNYTSGSVNEATVELNQGNWTFAAVAWDGTAATFEGTTLCALQSVNLNSTEQTVTLNLSASTCDDAAFGSNTMSSNFKPFALVTCGSLYLDQNPLTPLTTDNPGFCTSADLDPDMRVHAKAVKISVPAQIPGTPFNPNSPLSRCFDLINGADSTSLRLPAKGMPLHIDLLESSCADTPEKKMVSYPLQFGMDHSYSIFDRLYFTTSTFSRLYLPASLSRRGTSPFMASLPSFKCDATYPCVPVPTVTGPQVRYIGPGTEFFVKNKLSGELCSNLTITGNLVVGGTDRSNTLSSNDCREKDGKFYIRLSSTAMGSCSSTCSIDFDFKNDNIPHTMSVKVQAADPVLQAYDFIFRTLGFEDFTSPPATSTSNAMDSIPAFYAYGGDNEEKKNFGELSEAREMLRPDSLGGFFTNLSLSQLNNYSMTMQVWDEGALKPFHISIVADSSLVPAFMADDDDLTLVNNSTLTYSHRITLSQIVGGAYYPQMVIKFINGKQIGEIEHYHIDIDTTNDRRRTERSRTYWNTELPSYGRFEKYTYEKEVQNSLTTNVLNIRTSFVRAEREATTNAGNARLVRYEYDSRKDGATYDERASKTMGILNNDKAMYMHSSAELNNTTVAQIFSEPVFTNFMKATHVSSRSSSAVSPNGNHVVGAWSEYDSGVNAWQLRVVVKSATSAPEHYLFDTGADQPFIPRVTINNGGQAAVAWVEQNTGPNFYVFAMVKEGSSWKDTTNSTISNNGSPSSPLWSNGSTFQGFDIIDTNPLSTSTSSKAVFFVDTFDLRAKIYDPVLTPNWTSGSTLIGSLGSSISVTDLKANKVGSDYFVTAYYESSTDYLKVAKTNLSASSITLSNSAEVSSTTPMIQTLLVGTNLNIYAFDGSGGVIQYASVDTTLSNSGLTSSGLPAMSSYSSSTHRMYEPNSYCFNRNMTTAQALGDPNANPPTGCVLPNTSYAFPIRSEFKLNIESLHPTNIISIFGIN